mgnify:CR=1 FL=1|jgi:tape measure domain-containing protein
MSKVVDERVVQMQFDNSQFERNVSTSMSTLDKLKRSLNLSGAAKGLSDVGNAAKSISLNGLGSAVDTVRTKFSALQVMGVTALANITNSAVNAGKRIVNALTLEPIMSGFQEYETQINAVQTILANTKSKGSTLDDVNKALDELNLYADKTIYNFTEMTRNIGTFTAAGIDLKTSVSAIQGIANLAAVSGSTSQQASTAMYQLSQALAAGTVKLMDWNSVVNAGMGGEIFQNALKKTSEELNTGAEAAIKAKGSFRESLQTGWLTSEVLTETLKKFTTSGANEYVAEYTGLSKEAVAAALEDAKAKYGEADAIKYASKALAEKSGKNEEEIKSVLEMANTAEDAATKVKTFTQLWDTLKEAAQSGWTQSWEIIIGDFEEAKELLTQISDTIGAMIQSSADARNALLQGWKDLGGRDDLLEGFKNIFNGIMSVVKPVKEAFSEVFKAMTPEDLVSITKRFREFTEKLTLSGEAADKLKSILKNVFENLKLVKDAVGESLKNAFKGLISIVKPIKDAFTEVFHVIDPSSVEKVTTGFSNFTKKLILSEEAADKVKRAFKGIFSVFDIFRKILGSVAQAIAKLFNADGVSSLGDLLLTAAASIGDFFTSLNEGFDESGLSGVLSKIVSGFSSLISGATEHMKSFGDVFSFVGGTIKTVAGKIWEALKTVFGWISDNVSAGDIFAGLAGGGIFVTAKKFSGLIEKVKDAFDKLFGDKENGLKGKFADVMGSVQETLSSFSSGIKISSLVAIAAAIAILSVSMKTISELDAGQITKSLVAIGVMLGMLSITMKSITKTLSGLGSKGLIKAGVSLVLVAASVSILVGALKKMSDLSLAELAKGLLGIGVMLGELAIGLKIIGKTKIPLSTSVAMVALAVSCKILAGALEKFGDMSWDEITKGLAAMGGALAELVVAVSVLGKFGGGKSLFGSVAILITVQSLSKLADGLKKFGDMSWDTIKRGLVGMGGALGEVGIVLGLLGKFVGFSSLFAAGSILIVIQGLGDLAESFKKFGDMSWDTIVHGLAGMGGALGEVALITGLLGGLTGFSSILGAGSILIVIQGLADLADAFKRFGDMSWDTIVHGLAGMGGALAEVGIVTGLLGGLTGLSGILGAGALLLAIQGLGDLADAFKKFGEMTWDEIVRGLVGMGGALAEVAVVTGALGAIAGLPALLGSGAILLAVQGLGDLADALKKFGEMSWDEIGRGLSAMGGALGEVALGGVLNTLSGLGALSISTIADSLGVLADSVKKWAGVTIPEGLTLKLAALAAGVSAFTFSGIGAASLALAAGPVGTLADSVKKWTGVTIPDGLVEKMATLASGIEKFTFAGLGAGALSAAAPGVGEMADSIRKWSSVTIPEGLEDGLKQIASGVKAFSFAFVGGWSLSAITGPLGDLSASVKKWNNVSIPEDLGDGLKRLASGVQSFSFAFVGGWSLTAITGPLGDLADSVKKWKGVSVPKDLGEDLKSLSNGVIAFSWAFLGGWTLGAVTGPLGDLATSVKKWKDVSIPSDLGDDLKTLADGVKTFADVPDVTAAANGLKTISSSASKLNGINYGYISSGMQNLTNSIKNLASIESVGASLTKFGNELVNKIVVPIENATGRFKNVGGKLSTALASGIESRLSAIVSKVQEAMNKSVNAVTSKRSAFSSAGTAIATSLITGVSGKAPQISTAFSTALQSAVSSIKLQRSNFYNAGGYLVEGFANGIKDNAFKAQAKAIAMANAALQAAEDALDENSPSKEAYRIGDYFGLGFVNAIGDYGQKAYKTSHEMADQARAGLSNAISQIKNKIDGDMDVQPTIRPVIDLDNVRTGVNAISDMFGERQSIGLNANIGAVSSMMNRRSQNGNNANIVSAIDKIHKDINGISRPSYSIGGITYDAGSEVAEAIETLVRAAKIERRV